MSWIAHSHRRGWHYLFVRLPLRKSMEVGVQDLRLRPGGGQARFDLCFRLNFTGRDHAGLRFFVRLWRWFLEFNVCDARHWNHELNGWAERPEEEERVGCDVGQDARWLHGDAWAGGCGGAGAERDRSPTVYPGLDAW